MDELRQELKIRGYRLTSQREAVLRAIYEGACTQSVEEIHERAKQWLPSLGLTTVYRTLELLKHARKVQEIYLGDGKVRYEPILETHHHHLICQVCGKVEPVEGCFLSPFEGATLVRNGFQILGHRLELYGRCRDCQEG
ncbi:MAG: Fur family transcriptional regulator [Armatimonadota bacterium]|nr:Fur family transcriptional regulator [Armatimonadota bacterium]MDR5701980.1 Fur family transcriptional regulator [Armatimonadota bacterium]MDR7434722.1 Fur family transcriptional regulator [Armatimonadota bacterium]